MGEPFEQPTQKPLFGCLHGQAPQSSAVPQFVIGSTWPVLHSTLDLSQVQQNNQ